MLKTADRTERVQAAGFNEPVIDLIAAIGVLRRQRRLIICVLVLTIGAALVYLITAPSRYTGHAMLFFDVHSSDGLQQPVSVNASADSAYVDSQVEVLTSDDIARSVIKKLELDRDDEFLTPAHPILSAVLGFPSKLIDAVIGNDDGAGTARDPLGPLIQFFKSNLTVKRVGLTYVVDVNYRSTDRVKAANISNAVVDAYIVAQLDSKYQAARQAGSWLGDRVKELQAQAQNAETAVAAYKAQNDIADTGRALTEPELAKLSAQRRAALKDLESKAQTYRMLHEAFVQKATQQQSLPSSEARVVSKAFPPVEKSDPKTLLILAAALLIGTVGGIAAAFAREHLNAVFVSPDQVRKELGTHCLAVFPVVPALSGKQRRKLLPATAARSAESRIISRDLKGYTRAVDEPFSLWSEALRFLAADIVGMSRRAPVIGIGSALAGEGKTMTAANLAEVIADSGRKVLLVDCDLRNPGLTRRLTPNARRGLLDALSGAALEDLVWCDPATGMHLLPAPPLSAHATHPSGALSSAAMQKLLESARAAYQLVILDFPPIVQVADVKAASHLIDSFILVIEWGRTPQSTVLDALDTAPLVADKLIGAVLNKANLSVLAKLESYRSRTSLALVHDAGKSPPRAHKAA
jgi:capsular exopolysaccharide synthesis family protein